MVGEKDIRQISQSLLLRERLIAGIILVIAALCHYIIVILSGKTIYKEVLIYCTNL